MTAVTEERVLVGGLGFPEEPRWRDGALWFIDIWRKAVIGVSEPAPKPGGTSSASGRAASDGCQMGNW
jgi:hypothetical protein